MATTLLAIVIVLLATHALPDLARLRDYAWLRAWIARSNDALSAAPPWLRVVLVPVLLVLATALIQAGLHGQWFGFPGFAFAAAVLFLCWGPRDLDADIESVLKAPDGVRRAVAAQALNPDAAVQPLAVTAPALVEASFFSALTRHFGVLFWFVVLGPVGALGYRFAQLLARSPAFREVVGESREWLERVAGVLDWAPSHLMALSIALVSDFDSVVRSWRDYHAAHGKGYLTLDSGFLAVIARAGVDADVAAGDAGETGIGDPVTALADARVVLRRVLMLWLALIAVIVLGGVSG